MIWLPILLLFGCSEMLRPVFPVCLNKPSISFSQETVQCLPTTTKPPYTIYPIFIKPVTIPGGSKVIALSEFEVTNSTDTAMMIASAIELTNDLTGMGAGSFISLPNGFNVDPTMHHATITDVGAMDVLNDFTGYVVVWGWTAAEALPVNTALIVEQGYGKLDVITYGF